MIQAGKLRHRITIQENQFQRDEQNQPQRDEYGAQGDNWTDIRTCWASIEPLTGKEYFASQQMQAEVTTRIRIRYPGFQVWPGMRVKYRDPILAVDRFYDLESVIDQNEMHVELWLMAVESIKPIPAVTL